MTQLVAHDGQTYETTVRLTSADVKRITGFSPNKSRWQATVGAGKPFNADDADFAALQRYLKPYVPRVTNAATDAQIRYLVTLGVQLEDGMTKSRASELIDAARGGYLGSIGGTYTDGSN
jgi:hypothetical protein